MPTGLTVYLAATVFVRLTESFLRTNTRASINSPSSTGENDWIVVSHKGAWAEMAGSTRVPGIPVAEMTESSRVLRVPEAGLTEFSRVPRVLKAEMTESSRVPRGLKAEMT